MRIWVLSDLHLEHSEMRLPLKIPDADVCVCAGDVTVGGIVPSLRWLYDKISFRMPVVFVAGNHEFYGGSFIESLAAARELAPQLENVHFLDGDTVEINGTLFVGGTLWTDFNLLGQPDTAMAEAKTRMSDYREIIFSKQPLHEFLPVCSQRKHASDRAVIEHALAQRRTGSIVVVTHHAPSRQSLPEDERDRLLACAYASDLEDLITSLKPDLWVHGHIHERRDYVIGETRVIANPRGYPAEQAHARFDTGLVIEI